MKYFFCLLLAPFLSIAQTTFSGKIIDQRSKIGIPYASIGLMKANVGINADELGVFVLQTTKTVAKDTLIVSCMGYETQKLPVDKFEQLSIELTEKINILPEVKINKNNWTSLTINDFGTTGNSSLVSSGYSTQAADLFEAPEENSILKSVKIGLGHDIFSDNKTMFRIRVYDQDKIKNAPGQSLCNEIVEVKTSKKITSVDLTAYNIRIPNKVFFVAIEWLYIPYNQRISEATTRGNKAKQQHISYRPFISMRPIKETGTNDTWGFFPSQNTWQKMSFGSLMIATTIQY